MLRAETANPPFVIVMALIMLCAWAVVRYGESKKAQYCGFGIYLLIETVLFSLVLETMRQRSGLQALCEAAIAASALFCCLTIISFVVKRDLSQYASPLIFAGLIGTVLGIAGLASGFLTREYFFIISVGTFGVGWVLFNTSTVLHRYETKQVVPAALALFESFLTLFWYALRAADAGKKPFSSGRVDGKM